MEHTEIEIKFKPDIHQNLIWLVINGKAVCAVSVEQCKKIAKGAIDIAEGMYMSRLTYEVLLESVGKKAPVAAEGQFILSETVPMPGDIGIVHVEYEDGPWYVAGFWQGSILERKFAAFLRVRTLEEMGQVLHALTRDYGKFKDDLRDNIDTILDEAETIIKGSFG